MDYSRKWRGGWNVLLWGMSFGARISGCWDNKSPKSFWFKEDEWRWISPNFHLLQNSKKEWNHICCNLSVCKSCQCFKRFFLHHLQEHCMCVCVCVSVILRLRSPSSTRSLVLTGHQTLLLALINKIILELFSLRDILCGVSVLRPSGFGWTLVDDTRMNTQIVVC